MTTTMMTVMTVGERQYWALRDGCYLTRDVTLYTANLDPTMGVFDSNPVRVNKGAKIERFLDSKNQGQKVLVEVKHDGGLVYGWISRNEWSGAYENPSQAFKSPEVDVFVHVRV